MKKTTFFILMLAVAFMAAGCAPEGMPVYKPGSSHTGSPDKGDDPQGGIVTPPPAVAQPDYSRLTSENHPRIIFSQDDFSKIVSATEGNEALKVVHDIIINNKPNIIKVFLFIIA